MVGISSFGGYVPRFRLNRMLVFGAMGWLNPVNITNARGEKAVGNFDEDSITMAVAAGMDCMKGFEREDINGVYFASTTAPYKERQNANLVAGALGAPDAIRTVDFAGSLKAGTSALLSALEYAAANGDGKVMVCCADSRLGKMASAQEMRFGDAGAAFIVGSDDVIAEFKGSFSTAYDFVDHLRGAFSKYDRMWEERWIRDIGYGQFIPEAINGLCSKVGLSPGDFDKVLYPCPYGRARKNMNAKMELDQEKVVDDMLETVGDTGAAQPLLMLASALEQAQPGEKILVLSFGSGCDALYFEVTDAIKKKGGGGVAKWLARRADLDNYQKYLVWRGIAPADIGVRGEEDKITRWSLVWRNHKAFLGLQGSKCKKCGAQMFPPQRMCVNPACGAIDEMEPVYLADKGGTVFSFTGDMLAASVNPPAVYGNVAFNGGGKNVFDFTDCTIDDLAVGNPVDFTFRIKRYDPNRDITNYFWKAVPAVEEVK